jgi:hypothetical protein
LAQRSAGRAQSMPLMPTMGQHSPGLVPVGCARGNESELSAGHHSNDGTMLRQAISPHITIRVETRSFRESCDGLN